MSLFKETGNHEVAGWHLDRRYNTSLLNHIYKHVWLILTSEIDSDDSFGISVYTVLYSVYKDVLHL